MTDHATSGDDRPPRVAIYMPNLTGGGLERLMLALIASLRAGGAEVTLLLHSRSGPLRALLPPDLPVIAFGSSRTLFDTIKLARHLRRDRPDVLIANLSHNNIVALLAGLLAGRVTPVIVCQHNALSAEAARRGWKYRLVPLCYRLLAPLAAGFVAVSNGVADDMALCCAIRRDRITVIRNANLDLNFARLAACPVEHEWFRARTAPVFVAAGRLVAQKDHATLLGGFAALLRVRPARLLILGEGPLRAALERQAVELGVDHAVQFLGFCENPWPYYREADALVLTSRFEGFGLVLIEAMACGTPVITTDCPFGPAEIVDGGRYGMLVPVGDSDALARALASERWRDWPAETLRQHAATFDTAEMVECYVGLIHSVGALPRRRGRRARQAASGW